MRDIRPTKCVLVVEIKDCCTSNKIRIWILIVETLRVIQSAMIQSTVLCLQSAVASQAINVIPQNPSSSSLHCFKVASRFLLSRIQILYDEPIFTSVFLLSITLSLSKRLLQRIFRYQEEYHQSFDLLRKVLLYSASSSSMRFFKVSSFLKPCPSP